MSWFTQSKALVLFTQYIFYFLSFLCVTLHFIVTGEIANLTAVPGTHSIELHWIYSREDENCTVSYAIAWKDFTDESRNGSNVTEDNLYVIDSLEACVTYEVSVSALYVNGNESEAAFTNATTLPVGKWHVMCRFMSCAYYFLL